LPAAVTSLGDLTPGEFAFVLIVAAALSCAVFWHANRRGRRHATAWGVAVFLFAAVALPLYLLSLLMENRQAS
jgi:4-amino-4-deoxy-L-arabinose transferase-like glycosyltransferase